MRKKLSFLIATNLLLLLLIPSVGIANIDEDVMTAGDTFIYSVTTFDVPWNELFADMPLPFPMEDLVLDLSGSTLGVKVMAVDDRNGVYNLNSYIILGETITIPFPEGPVPPEVGEVFGNSLVIPEGVGIGIGQAIPGSDFLDFIASQTMEGFPGLPFYLDPGEWNVYEDFFNSLDEALGSDANIVVTNDGDEFIVAFDGAVVGIEIDINVVWHRTGTYKGIFKSIKGTVTGDFSGLFDGGYISEPSWTTEPYWTWTTEPSWTTEPPVSGTHSGSGSGVVTLEVEVSFDEKRHNPLPNEILDLQDITLVLDVQSLEYTTDGFFNYNQFDSFFASLDDVQGQLANAEGKDMFVFDVTDVDGCFYTTNIDVYGEGEDPGNVLWNGFTGVAGGPNEFSPGIIPIGAPGITPDWDMWRASILSISSILEIVEDTFTTTTATSELEAVGLTINEFDITYEMRTGEGLKFFFLQGNFDVEFDASMLVPSDGTSSVSPNLDAVVSFEMWLAYTTKGLIAGVGTDISVAANFVDWPQTENQVADGSITLDLGVELRNEDINELPDPIDLPEDTKGENGGGGDGITPGFSIIPALLMFAAVAVIIKRRK